MRAGIAPTVPQLTLPQLPSLPAGYGTRLVNNRCESMPGASYCVYIAPAAKGTIVGCTNSNAASGARSLCNCSGASRCASTTKGGPDALAARNSTGSGYSVVTGYAVPGMPVDDEEMRPSWD